MTLAHRLYRIWRSHRREEFNEVLQRGGTTPTTAATMKLWYCDKAQMSAYGSDSHSIQSESYSVYADENYGAYKGYFKSLLYYMGSETLRFFIYSWKLFCYALNIKGWSIKVFCIHVWCISFRWVKWVKFDTNIW